MKKNIMSLILCCLLFCCASVSTNLYRTGTIYQPTEPSRVSIFLKKPPNETFIEIGEITVSEVPHWSDAEKELKSAAAKVGGDAVYIINNNSQTEAIIGSVHGGGVFGVMDTQTIVTGVVIKYN